MTDAPRADVLFYVQHLLGVGHLRRAAVIAEALERAGLAVVFVTGGPPDPLVAPRGCHHRPRRGARGVRAARRSAPLNGSRRPDRWMPPSASHGVADTAPANGAGTMERR